MEEKSIAEQPNQLSKSVDVAVKFVGDFGVLPGASQLMNGKVGAGFAHAALGIGARLVGGATVGPIAWAVIASNSFTKSVSNKSIWEHAVGTKDAVVSNREQRKTESLKDELKLAMGKDESDRTDEEKELVATARSLAEAS